MRLHFKKQIESQKVGIPKSMETSFPNFEVSSTDDNIDIFQVLKMLHRRYQQINALIAKGGNPSQKLIEELLIGPINNIWDYNSDPLMDDLFRDRNKQLKFPDTFNPPTKVILRPDTICALELLGCLLASMNPRNIFQWTQ